MRAGTVAWIMLLLCTAPAWAQTKPRSTQLAPPAEQLQISLNGMKIETGAKFFFDPRLSDTGQVACVTCHDPRFGYADGRRTAVGRNGRVGVRNTPTALFAYGQLGQFWDMRTTGTKAQSLQPLANPDEMGQQTARDVANRLNRIPGYRQLMQAMYRNPQVTPERMADCMEAFERTLTTPFNAPIDLYLAGDESVLSDSSKRGYKLFIAANCVVCHKPPFYRDDKLHNTGVAFAFNTRDGGRGGSRAFKTGTLRQIRQHPPYTHAGVVPTLAGMVEHYNRGGAAGNGRRDANIDPLIRPLGLSRQQKEDLTTFLVEAFISPDYPFYTSPVLP